VRQRRQPTGTADTARRSEDEGGLARAQGYPRHSFTPRRLRISPPGWTPVWAASSAPSNCPKGSGSESAQREISRQHADARGAITLIVTQRFSTIAMADLIIVLHDSEVVEQGDHLSLMRTGGRYASTYRLQQEASAAGIGVTLD
jgi:hypothetical protein